MKRKIEQKLIKWKNSNHRKPLIVRGARQVGKTWSIEKFGKEYFDKTIVLDFERNLRYHSFFEDNLNPKTILQNIEIIKRVKIDIDSTLLFFDEIQSCPRAIMSLRYFYEEMPELHIIAAGSLLDFALDKISFPVGRIQYLNMYPLSFSEFLLARNNQTAYEIIKSKPKKLPNSLHNTLISELKKYLIVGGMPESVKRYIENQSFLESFQVQDELIMSMKDDFSKYAPRISQQCLEDVFINSSKNVGNQVTYSNLSNSFSSPTIKKAFEILIKARIIKKVASIGILKHPFDIQSSSKKFKIIALDIGFWQRLSGLTLEREIIKNELMDIYRGNLVEQFVGQELLASSKNDRLFYWARNKRSSNAEIDYVVSYDGEIYPIEVKSGSSGSLKSMHLALKEYPNCKTGLVFSTREYAELPEQKLMFLPLYYAGTSFQYL